MSLDVYLEGPVETVDCRCPDCENVHSRQVQPCYFRQNITHNLLAMAEEAGVRDACWYPEDIGAFKAAQLVPLLEAGLAKLKAEPEKMKKHDAGNGWGVYEHFVPWVASYLAACKEYPEADVRVSR